MSFLARLFGISSPPKAPATPRVALADSVHPPVQPQPQVFLEWNEMIDGNSRIAGYLLRSRSLRAGENVEGAALLAALENERVLRFAQQRPMVIAVSSQQWKEAAFSNVAAPCSYFWVTDDPALGPVDEEVLAQIGASGAKRAALLDQDSTANLLLVNFQETALSVLETKVKALRQQRPDILIAAEGIASWAEHRLAQSIGINFSIGAFAASRDDAEAKEGLSQSRLVVMEMLNLLRQHAEPAQLVATAKRDPAIAVQLLNMANSPVYGFSRELGSIEDAILVLGHDALYRWLAIALFKLGDQGGRDETLLVLALGRAHFLESIASKKSSQVAEELFLVGLLSVMDSLLGLPMERFLAQMTLPEAVASVLTQSDGPYARYLSLVFAMERNRETQMQSLAEALGLSPDNVVCAYNDAMALALDELQQQ